MSITQQTTTFGDISWYKNGKVHRDNDFPAIVSKNGIKFWYQNDRQHRDGDLPAVEHVNGYKAWYQRGLYHRERDQPAIVTADGDKHWYKNGKLHRDGDQPAIEYANGNKHWWKYNKQYTRQQLTNYYSRLAKFGRYSLKQIRLSKLKHKRWIHGELLCMPPKGNFLGGQDYHKMADYFINISKN